MNVFEETAGRWYAPPRAVLREPHRVKWEKLTYERRYIGFGKEGFWAALPIWTVKEFTPDTTTISVKWVNVCLSLQR